MVANELNRQDTAIKISVSGEILNRESSNKAKLTEERSEAKKTHEEQLNSANLPEVTGFVLPTYLAIMAVVMTVFAISRKNERDRITNFLISLERVPCRNCRFFSLNQYLKCAVHPSVVMTKQAIDCPDYCPKDSKLPD